VQMMQKDNEKKIGEPCGGTVHIQSSEYTLPVMALKKGTCNSQLFHGGPVYCGFPFQKGVFEIKRPGIL